MALREEWQGFSAGHWTDDVNVRDFIQRNYTQYDGDESFLAGPTEATDKLWGKVQELQKQERANGGVLDCETEVVSGLTAYGPGYIDPELKDLEKVVGLQSDTLGLSDPSFHIREATVYASRVAQMQDFRWVLDQIESGNIRAERMITDVSDFAHAKESFEEWVSRGGAVFKGIIEVE